MRVIIASVPGGVFFVFAPRSVSTVSYCARYPLTKGHVSMPRPGPVRPEFHCRIDVDEYAEIEDLIAQCAVDNPADLKRQIVTAGFKAVRKQLLRRAEK